MDNKLIVILLLVLGFFMYMKYSVVSENLNNVSEAPVVAFEAAPQAPEAAPVEAPVAEAPAAEAPVIAEPAKISEPANVNMQAQASVEYKPTDMAAKIVSGSNQLTADDLLPKYDEASDFAKENPVSSLLKEQNFLVSGYHMGINTVLQSNKIPYHDLRSAPVIPKQTVGPWAQSSYDEAAGQNRRHFELGA
jgi:hypothetical protein